MSPTTATAASPPVCVSSTRPRPISSRTSLYIHVAQETASLQGDLSDLTDLRSENIKTVVFSTVSCTSTLSLSDVAALGAGSTPFALSHSGSTSTFTVGGADHPALLR